MAYSRAYFQLEPDATREEGLQHAANMKAPQNRQEQEEAAW